MKYFRLVCSRALRETKTVWTPQKMWLAFASPVVTVPLRGLFYGWAVKDLWFTMGATLLAMTVLWGGTFLVHFLRSPALIHNEQPRRSRSNLLQGASEAEIAVLNCISNHGEIEQYQLERAMKDRPVIASALERWRHTLIGERVEQGTNRTSYFILPGHKAAVELALASRDQPAS